MFAATTDGHFQSIESGVNRQPAKIGPADQLETECWSVSMHPATAGDANSTKEVFRAAPGGLYRSFGFHVLIVV